MSWAGRKQGLATVLRGGRTRGRRPGLRLALILLVILAALFLLNFLLPRPSQRIVVAELPEDTAKVTGTPAQVRIIDQAKMRMTLDQAKRRDADLLIFVAKPDHNDGVPRAAQWRAPVDELRTDTSPRVILVVSATAARDMAKALSPGAQELGPGLYQAEQRQSTRPGLVLAALWVLALLGAVALLARAFVAPPAARDARLQATALTPTPSAPSQRLQGGSPVSSGEGVVVADWPGPSPATVHPVPQRGEVDLSRFPVRDETPRWVPQCPHCGAFHPRNTVTDNADACYRCSYCGEAWHVSESASWPTVVVDPRHRRAD